MVDIRKKLFRYSRKIVGRKRTIAFADALFRLRHRLSIGTSIDIKLAIKVGSSRMFVSGFVLSGPVSLTLVSSGGDRIALENKIEWYQDSVFARKMKRVSDKFKPMFVGLIDLNDTAITNQEWSIEVKSKNKWLHRKRLKVMTDQDNTLDNIKNILSTVPASSTAKRTLFDNVYGPVVSDIWSLKKAREIHPVVVDYGLQYKAKNPTVSLVIPLYGRYDFMEYQLSVFSLDEDMVLHEIIYVVDDPSIESAVKKTSEDLSRLYDIHFKVIYLPFNLGFAGANNAGVKFAEAETLLLLNSDILPSQDGWLGQMVSRFSAHQRECLMGARLLYEDGTIQHDGMEYFSSPFMGDLWTNTHPGKGLPESLFPHHENPVRKEAVTGACMLIKKNTFLHLGGFDESYILGDFEDSDLCLKAVAADIDILLDTQTRLYHLERQSQSLVTDQRWKDELTYYNCWQHHGKWANSIVVEKHSVVGMI